MLLLLIKDIGKAKTLVYEYETKDRFNNIYLKKIYYVPFLILHENIHIPLTTPKYRSCERKIIDTFRKNNVLVDKNSILSIYSLTQNGNHVWHCLLKKIKMEFFSKCYNFKIKSTLLNLIF